jgi:thiol-disulfide isomerase/thioredoxin
MKIKSTFITAMLLIVFTYGIAQDKSKVVGPERAKRVYIGDKVPEVCLNNIRNYKSERAKLSDFVGKAVIIDFWSEGCSACINGLPKMQKLQDKFGEKLQILLVTDHSIDRFRSLFKNSPNVRSSKLPMVFENTILYKEMFPHTGDPRLIWIDKYGIVKSMTHSIAASTENVHALIEGKPLNEFDKAELDIMGSLNGPILAYNNGQLLKYVLQLNKIDPDIGVESKIDTVKFGYNLADSEFSYYSVLMKSMKHLGLFRTRFISNPSRMGVSYANLTVPFMFTTAYNLPADTKVIIEGEGEKYFKPNKDATPMQKAIYEREFTYHYELIAPNYNSENFKLLLKRDIENFFNMKGILEMRPTNCIVLFRTSSAENLRTKGGVSIAENTGDAFVLKNAAFGLWMKIFDSNNEHNTAQFVNESGISPNKKVDMIIRSSKDDMGSLNQELKKYGLGIKEEIRTLPSLVLSKIK